MSLKEKAHTKLLYQYQYLGEDLSGALFNLLEMSLLKFV